MDLPACLLLGLAVAAAPPSRPAVKGCTWETFSDAHLGLSAWVQRCDFGFRRIDFLARGQALAVRYSDGGGVDPVVEVHDLAAGETVEAGIGRVAAAGTPPEIARRCRVEPWSGTPAPPPGVRRYTFAPDPTYRQELQAKANPDEVPEPPCGERGDWPDGIQYWEAQGGAQRVLFVRVGQDEPLFDEQTLRLLPGR